MLSAITDMCPMMTVSESAARRAGPPGFTLMEILVSIAVIAIVLVSLFRIQSGSIDLTAANRFHNTAPFLAKKQLALIESDLTDKESDQGEFEPPFDTYQWRYAVSDADIDGIGELPENEAGGLKRIEIEIIQAHTNRSYRVNTFRWHDAS